MFVVLLFTACSDNSLLNEPVSKNEISFLKMPGASAQLAKIVEFSALINGNTGGRIPINHSYTTLTGKFVFITGSLEIPANAFTGIKIIRIKLNDEYAYIDFSPSPSQFDVPLKLNIKYQGINLYGLDKNKVNFYFISDDMQRIESINSQSKIFDLQNESIGIIKAELNHFSRFGWVI
jgi:hypothetical protein